MTDFYHVDRYGYLKEEQILTLSKWTNVSPIVLQKHVDLLFPDGVSPHGERYLLCNEHAAPSVADANLELIYEYIRRANFPDRPSRFQSIFAFENLDSAKRFRDQFSSVLPHPANSIWLLEANRGFRANMRLLTRECSVLGQSCTAHFYWQGVAAADNPFWEILLVPPIRVLQRII